MGTWSREYSTVFMEAVTVKKKTTTTTNNNNNPNNNFCGSADECVINHYFALQIKCDVIGSISISQVATRAIF